MSLVAPIDRDQIRREGLDLSAIAQSTCIDPANSCNAGRKSLHQVGRLTIIPDHQDIGVNAVDVGIQEQHGRNMVKGSNYPTLHQNRGGLLSCRALRHRQCVCTLLVEAKWIDTVNNDLACELIDQALQQLRVPIPRHRDDDDICLRCAVLIRTANYSAADLICNALCSGSVTRSDDDALSRECKSARKPATLLSSATKHSDSEVRNFAMLLRITLRSS